MYKWARYSTNGYEVSSKGDKRFSAFFARLSDGRSIEEAYQLDIKGYRKFSDDPMYGKRKPPLVDLSQNELWLAYKQLWATYLDENLDLEKELSIAAKGKVLTDMFANTDISQARALAELLNERYPDKKRTKLF